MTDRNADATCLWVASDQPRAVKGEHYDACEDDACRGCWPCRADHCVVCRREHCDTAHPFTCPSCVGDVRNDLEMLDDMHARLHDEAEVRSMSGDHEDTVLGGDAMVMLAMRYREQTGLAADGDHSHESEADPVPTLLTVATWEDCWRDHLGHEATTEASVSDAVAYLGQMLTHMAQNRDLPFEDFVTDIRQTRSRLEDVLRDGIREETGAPCPACREAGERARPLLHVHNDRDTSGASDRWVCPRNRAHWWPEAGYRLRIGGEYRANAAALTVTDMATEHGISRGSLTGWASKGLVRKRGKDANGRQLYDVADALAAKSKRDEAA